MNVVIFRVMQNGKSFCFDKSCADIVDARQWRLLGRGYVAGKKNGQTVLLHRLIVNPLPGYTVDHINGNKRDNRRCNLRLATYSENGVNRNPIAGRKYKGTKRVEGTSRWSANVKFKHTDYYLGTFATEEEAARAYNVKAKEIHGKFFRPNVVGNR